MLQQDFGDLFGSFQNNFVARVQLPFHLDSWEFLGHAPLESTGHEPVPPQGNIADGEVELEIS